ncbi:hypothetical protein M9H77_05518 [Catharanthus roseus]|uniref:Uncharacterized protein n=1 Tax=Catharanthus roseus TaxID=4058 RepID=A0ACC0CH74_CATRO|nr:hypothetical protein M9H77_05518 [Catharanthus roseus]
METNNGLSGEDRRRILKLRCSVKNYDWGRIGTDSAVARLYERNNAAELVDGMPYAEFWMGTHDSGPSYVLAPDGKLVENGTLANSGFHKAGLSLKEWIEQNPRSVLGDKVFAKWGPNLPFLFKVLSVAKALSIQAHPDKELAARLHKVQPDSYKDANHKPEMALALTEFEALCGFISLEELKDVVHNVPEIVEVVSRTGVDKLLAIGEQDGEDKAKEVLQLIFTQLMSARKEVIEQVLLRLISRLTAKREAMELTDKEKLILRLEKQYPSDIGVLAAFLLNHVKLSPGEALYLGANEPHAYIYGECIECMATSDNVVRAGLTPKERDVQTLCSMLTYKQGLPEILQGVALNPYVVRYLPPFDEFEVDSCVLPEDASVAFPAISGPSIFLVMAGEGTICSASNEELVEEGDVVFTSADTEVTLATTSGMDIYRAGVSSRFLCRND